MSSNPDSIIYPLFRQILYALKPHLLQESLGLHVKENDNILIKLLKFIISYQLKLLTKLVINNMSTPSSLHD